MTKQHFMGVALLLLTVVAGACSGSDNTSNIASLNTDSATSSTEAVPDDPLVETEDAMLAWAACMRDEGFEVDDPTVDVDGNVQLPPITMEAEVAEDADPDEAFAALDEIFTLCEEHLAGMTNTFEPQDTTDLEDAFLAYAQCMRSEGIDMPDPDFSGGSGIVDLGVGDEDGFEEAHAACDHHISSLGVGG